MLHELRNIPRLRKLETEKGTETVIPSLKKILKKSESSETPSDISILDQKEAIIVILVNKDKNSVFAV